MASAIDAGQQSNIHPWKKEIVGQRLAASAKKTAYGIDVVATGPTMKSVDLQGDKAIVSFTSIGSGLETRQVELDGHKIDASELKGFAVCGSDHEFKWADAVIKGEQIVVSHPDIDQIVAVRYGWADFPLSNLYNKEGFPANPFRSDNFDPVAQ